MDYSELFGPGGFAREHMRNGPGGGPWVDGFCDGLVEKLEAPHLEEIVTDMGAYFVSYGPPGAGTLHAINVRWTKDTGFTIYRGKTYDEVLAEVFINGEHDRAVRHPINEE